MANRRQFLSSLGATAGVLAMPPFLQASFATHIQRKQASIAHLSPSEIAKEEDFWAWVKSE